MIVNLEQRLFKASLTVSYPSGSCTVSLGGTSYTHSGGGSHTFTLRKAGTWTVTATDGSKSDSATVLISQRGQSESLSLAYDLVIFDGADNTALTGGWANSSYYVNPTVTVGSSLKVSISFSNQYYSCGTVVYSKNKIDLSNLSRLDFSVSALSQNISSEAIDWELGVISAIPTGTDLVNPLNPVKFAASSVITRSGNYSVDVSRLSGSYYVAFYTAFVGKSNGSRDKGGSITTTKIIGA